MLHILQILQKSSPVVTDLRPMLMETRSSKLFSQIYCFQRTAENFLVPPMWGKKRKKFNCLFLFLFFPTAGGGAICFVWLQIVNTVIETSSCGD